MAKVQISTWFLSLIIFHSSLCTTAQGKTVESAGNFILFTLPAAALGNSLMERDMEGTWQFTKGFILNQAVTVCLKYAINKDRPDNNGGRAFPSGHTSTTFQTAAFVQRRYGWKFGIPSFALAGFTGYSRIEAKKHDGWDVISGAVIGSGMGYLFTTPFQRAHLDIAFNSSPDNFLLGINYTF